MADRDPLEEDFRDFVAARSGALLRTAYLLTGDWATAEDLLQTALTKTYLASKRLGGIEAIEPYARRVMVNTSTSWWRRRWHGERPTEVLPERAGVDEIERQLDRDVLWRHLRALPSRQRAVLVLRFYEDMSEAQTAALLEISPGTVKSQTSRALATLRRRMGEQAALDLAGDPSERVPVGGRRVTRADGRPAPEAPAPVRVAPRPAGSRSPARRPLTAAPSRIPAGAALAAPPADGRPRLAARPAAASTPPGPDTAGQPAEAAPRPVAAVGTEAAPRPVAAVGARPVGARRR
ncbi:SigE family RNA polymerase sigma factor [Micromonospora sp. DT233]|uniref:SigE family RNA polymerase sigma factor n=1 Tax=Micromonospora sp. DT233 TaxID=3393432 RepID=UPI003CEE1990